MRVVRTVAGLVLLTIGLPVLLVGGSLWTLMQHRDAGGAFSGTLEPVSTPGQAIVVTDVDKLLREDAAFVRAGDTRMRLTGASDVFFGLGPADAVREYLSGSAWTRVDAVTVARGDLPVRSTPIGGEGVYGPAASGVAPGSQSFWVRQGSGTLEWTANEVDGRELSLVVMHVDASPALTVTVRAAASPGWLPPTSWILLAAGVLLIAGGITALAWPTRPRDVVFVVDPSQVPQVSARLGAATLDDREGPAGPPPVWPALPAADVAEPLPVLPGEPSRAADGPWPGWPSDNPPARPATLADALAGAGLPSTPPPPPPPGPAWPPAQPGPADDAESVTPSASAWRRAEAARLAGMPGVTAVAAQLSVEISPTSGAPAGAATAIPTTRAVATDDDNPAAAAPDEADGRAPTQRSGGVAHLRSVQADGTERPAKRTARAKKRPVVFVDTATEPTGESPDRPVVAARPRTTKPAPQPREAAGNRPPTTDAAAAQEPTAETTAKPPSTHPGQAAAAGPGGVSAEGHAAGQSVEKTARPKSGRGSAEGESAGDSVVVAARPGANAASAEGESAGDSAIPAAHPGASADGGGGGYSVVAAARPGASADGGAAGDAVVVTARAGAGSVSGDAVESVGEKPVPAEGTVAAADGPNDGQVVAGEPAATAAKSRRTAAGSRRGKAVAEQPMLTDATFAQTTTGSGAAGSAAAEAPVGHGVGDSDAGGVPAVKEPTKKPRRAASGVAATDRPKATRSKSRANAVAQAEDRNANAAIAEPMTTTGTEVIESAGSAADEPITAGSPAGAGTPVGTGTEVATTGDQATGDQATGDQATGDQATGDQATAGDPATGDDAATGAKPAARRATRAKKATAAETPDKVQKPTRSPRRKAAETAPPATDETATSEPAEATDDAARESAPATNTAAAADDGIAATAMGERPRPAGATLPGTPFGGLGGTATPAKRRRKTAAGLPAPETTDAGPVHNAVAALAAKRPATTRRRAATSAKRPADNRANPTDQAS
ncbi:hypothetical protein [Asanoa siamensis]|nr:hypothetical protein [Asanoa siamensis]